MRTLFLLHTAILLSQIKISAQINLVPNPGFEIFSSCPDGTLFPNEILRAVPWTNPTQCSPDYFHQCGSNGQTVPGNMWGNEMAKTGLAYAGVVAFQPSSVRDYIQVQLTDTLIAGNKYLIEFNVSLSDLSMYSVNTLAVYFSTTAVTGTGCIPLSLLPQIVNPSSNPLTSKNGWIKISDTLIASGGELYMTIGNFHSDTTSDTLFVGGSINEAYYYIDDVSVTDVTNVGLTEYNNMLYFNLFPNPSAGIITVDCEPENRGKTYLEIYDVLGNKILTTELVNKETQINLLQPGLRSGIYFYMVKSEGNFSKSGKLILSTE